VSENKKSDVRPCPVCRGKGSDYKGQQCIACLGSGELPAHKSDRIPANKSTSRVD
jgi:DnaJ-class molecular chaperone